MERANVKLVQKDWTLIDDHVKKVSDSDAASFASLISYLDKPISNRLDRDIYMTRAIIYWMFHAGNRDFWSDQYAEESPLTFLKAIHNRKKSRQDLFQRLCNAAGIPCECVKGISKFVGFEPGQRDTKKFKATWNKVELEGFWWPVYPDWIMQSVASDNQSIVAQFTEFWFLTDPETFIYKCFPDDIQDQMLPVSKQIKNVRKFAKLPLLTYHFFKHNMKMTSEESSVVEADDGICVVSFKADSALAKTLSFYYILTLTNLNGGDPQRLVFNSRRKGHFIFEVRCPVLGEYKLEIRGGPINVSDKLYVTTKIECLEKAEDIFQLPIDAGKVGWGFGPSAESAGLFKPSEKDPKLTVKGSDGNYDEACLEFSLNNKITGSKQFEATLHNTDMEEYELRECVETIQTSENLTIKVQVQHAGEYALSISTHDSPGSEGIQVCNYLITTLEDPDRVAEEYEDSSDGLSEIDEENFALEKEVAELEMKLNELMSRAESSLSTVSENT